jgi:hypothetical protein
MERDMQHETQVTTTTRLYATRYDTSCSCAWTAGTFPSRASAAAAAEEHLERSEKRGDAVSWVTPA